MYGVERLTRGDLQHLKPSLERELGRRFEEFLGDTRPYVCQLMDYSLMYYDAEFDEIVVKHVPSH